MRHASSVQENRLVSRASDWLCALSLAWALPACGISPKPDPPDVAFDLDPDRIAINAADSPEEPIELLGGPGAAGPPGATLRLYPLGSDLPRVEAEIAADGS